jgi:hypothetical protein
LWLVLNWACIYMCCAVGRNGFTVIGEMMPCRL